MVLELHNASDTTKIIRDFNLYLYKQDVLVDKMIQTEYMKGKEYRSFGTDNNSFDTVIAKFYDEDDTQKESTIIKGLSSCWSNQLYEADEEWTELCVSESEKTVI